MSDKRTLIERLEWPQGESLFDLLKDARAVLTDMPDDVLGAAAFTYSAFRIERIGTSYYVFDEREMVEDGDDGIIGVFSDIVDANKLVVKHVLMEAQAVWRTRSKMT
jgi:CRISPR/Cas system-associated endonuclease/helicase Cas3